ncbi:MAG: hypothetical protein HY795_04355 [Desulfovibrio sp.]|nr:hypothetical protein [Desulfovibrio sp.]MBI4960404.1 hypothetical protein [Desulfovibrio sp.]
METASLVALIMTGLLTVAGGLGGLWAKNLYDQHKLLAARCERLEQDLASHREKTAEVCVRRDDYQLMRQEMLDQLHAIREKLDRIVERMGARP